MKVEVGYITGWRRAIFFSLVLAVVIFGFASTLSTSLLGAGVLSNIISVAALIICIILFIFVLADKWGRYTDFGMASADGGFFDYKDKKRNFHIRISEIEKVDMERITTGRESGRVIAYRLLIKTPVHNYYVESDRASGRAYNEVDLYRLYTYLNEITGA